VVWVWVLMLLGSMFDFRLCSALRVPPAETRLTVYRRFEHLTEGLL